MKVLKIEPTGCFSYGLEIELTDDDIVNILEEWTTLCDELYRASEVPVWINTFMNMLEEPEKKTA